MIVVRVELHPASGNGQVKEIGRMRIMNVTEESSFGSDYHVRITAGQAEDGRDEGIVRGHPRHSSSIWWLALKAIWSCNYKLSV